MQRKKEEIARLINNITVLQKDLSSPLWTGFNSEDPRTIFGYPKGIIDMTDDLLEEVKRYLGEVYGE